MLPAARYLRTKEAASYLNVSTSWLEKLRVRGGGPPFSRLGARVVYRCDDLESWVAQHRVRSTSEVAAPADWSHSRMPTTSALSGAS